ncbi:acyltransferase [Candidatus Dojkabacteria bacterium]|nr:acyltransferase [Candidatus Dojkabacteria bacterium]
MKDILRKLAIIASFLFTLKYRIFYHNRVKFGKNFICNYNLYIKGPGKVIFGDNVNAWTNFEPNRFQTFSSNAVIKIGLNTRLNGVWCQSRSSINVGNDCIVGSAIIIDTDFHSLGIDRKTNTNIPSEDIVIKDNVWIAGQSAILKGVNIGENSVVGFRAVVAKDVPKNSVVAGNPANVVKMING